MTPFHNKVSLRGFHFEDFHLTVNLSGLNAVTNSRDVVGKAVTIDATAPNTFKLAGDGDRVFGRLATFENRIGQGEGVVGAVEFVFSNSLPIADGQTVNVGDTVVGAGDGTVKSAASPASSDNFVAAIEGTYAVVVKL